MNPTLYKPEFCEMVIKHMSQGLSFESFGSVAKCGYRTLYDWIDKYPDFKRSKLHGESQSMAFFEKNLILKLTGQNKNIDPFLVQFALKSRFHKIYGDKKQVETEDDDTLEFK